MCKVSYKILFCNTLHFNWRYLPVRGCVRFNFLTSWSYLSFGFFRLDSNFSGGFGMLKSVGTAFQISFSFLQFMNWLSSKCSKHRRHLDSATLFGSFLCFSRRSSRRQLMIHFNDLFNIKTAFNNWIIKHLF